MKSSAAPAEPRPAFLHASGFTEKDATDRIMKKIGRFYEQIDKANPKDLVLFDTTVQVHFGLFRTKIDVTLIPRASLSVSAN